MSEALPATPAPYIEPCVGPPLRSEAAGASRAAGLVEVRPEAQRRIYRVRTEPLRALEDWLQPYRKLWESRLDDLERHLDSMPDPEP